MKKLLAILLAVVMVISMATVASAANTTTLTTSVPAATYTLNIPADQVIPFGATETDLGMPTVSASAGFAKGKNLQVTVTYEDFKNESVSTTIHCSLRAVPNAGASLSLLSGSALTFYGKDDGSVDEIAGWKENSNFRTLQRLSLEVSSSNWGKALAGEYTTTIIFSAEVVAQ